MENRIEEIIITKIKDLDFFQQKEILNFIDFLRNKNNTAPLNLKAIDEICGKYKDFLPSSDDFAALKKEEITLEDNKWNTT